MNIVVIGKSFIDNKSKSIVLNNDLNGIFINESLLPISKSDHYIYDYQYFITYYNHLGIVLPTFSQIETIQNVLSISSIESIPIHLLESLKNDILSNGNLFNQFISRNKPIYPILFNGYNAIMRNHKNETYKEMKRKYNIVHDYNVWNNSTWRITNGLQNKKDVIFDKLSLSIDIKSQDFSVVFNILGLNLNTDPFTYLSEEIQESRSHIKKISQMFIFGATPETLVNTCYENNIPIRVYEKIISHPIFLKIFSIVLNISSVKRLYSYYLNRPIPIDSKKNFSRFIQSSSSDLTLYILSELEKNGYSKFLSMIRHDEFIFTCDDIDMYSKIISFFQTQKHISINKKPLLNLFYTVSFKQKNEVLEKFNI